MEGVKVKVEWMGEVCWVYFWGLVRRGRGDVHGAAREGVREHEQLGEEFCCGSGFGCWIDA